MSRPTPSNLRLSLVFAMLAVGLHIAGAALMAAYSGFPSTLDEIQHLSYARWMAAWPELFPHYEAQHVLDPATMQWGAHGTYLNHPSPYYHLMGWLDRLLGGSPHALRWVQVALSTIAVALMIAASFRVLPRWPERAVFALALVFFPKLAVVAGIINNDNLALVVVAFGFLTLIGWQQHGRRLDAMLLTLALAAAGWTKFTVFLMLAFAAAFAELIRLASLRQRPDLAAYALIAAGGLVGAIPTLMNFRMYGRALYHSMEQFTPHAERIPMTGGEYAILFFHQLAMKWSAAEPTQAFGSLGLALVLILAAAALIAGFRAIRRDPQTAAPWRVALSLMLALIPTLLLHLYFGWQAVVEDGFLYMAQTRYYYAVWPGFALGLALLWRAWRPGPLRVVVALTTLASLVYASAGVVILLGLIRGAGAFR